MNNNDDNLSLNNILLIVRLIVHEITSQTSQLQSNYPLIYDLIVNLIYIYFIYRLIRFVLNSIYSMIKSVIRWSMIFYFCYLCYVVYSIVNNKDISTDKDLVSLAFSIKDSFVSEYKKLLLILTTSINFVRLLINTTTNTNITMNIEPTTNGIDLIYNQFLDLFKSIVSP